MLSVLLTILKIIGLILLWVLIAVLVILLIVLAAPIRYRAEADVHGTYDIEARVTWLLRAVSFKFSFKDKQASTKLKICGITLGGKKEKEEEAAAPEEQKEPPENKAEENKAEEKPPEEIKTPEETEKKEEQPKEEKKEKAEKKPKEKKNKEEQKKAEETGEEEIPLPEKIIATLRKVKYKISEIIHKFDPESPLMQKLDFITNLRTKHAIGLVLRFVGKLLKHILPRKGSGYIRYGFDDPSLTGRILAGAAMLTPLHKNEIRIQPDFQEQIFEADAILKGKIVLGYIVVKAVALVLKKDVLFVLKNYKKYFK